MTEIPKIRGHHAIGKSDMVRKHAEEAGLPVVMIPVELTKEEQDMMDFLDSLEDGTDG